LVLKSNISLLNTDEIYAQGILNNVIGHKLSYLQLCGYKIKINVKFKQRKSAEFFG
jgi:hypothetical protein